MIKNFLLLSVLAAAAAGGVFALTDSETMEQGAATVSLANDYRYDFEDIDISAYRFGIMPLYEWQLPSMNLVSSQNSAAKSSAGKDDPWVFYEFSVGRRLSASFLNLLFGLGSFTMGDSDGGFEILAKEMGGLGLTGLGVGLVFGSSYVFSATAAWGAAAWIFLLPIVIPVVVITAGIVCGIAGITYLTSGIITGFRRPFIFKRPVKTARLNDANNWSVGFVPDINGEPIGQIAFTMHL